MIYIYYLRQDIIFKSVFKDKIKMKRLIEEAINIKINRVIQLNTEQAIDNIHEKKKILDIIVDTDQGIINIELNNNYNSDLYSRNFIYFCKLVSSNISTGESYKKLPKHIQINLTWNIQKYHNKDISGLKKLTYNLTEDTSKEIIHPYFQIIEINMDYYENLCYNNLEEEDKFFKLLASQNLEEMREISKGDEIMEKITKKVEDYNIDPEIINKIELENDYEKLQRGLLEDARNEGLNQGLEQGISQGISQGIIQTAKNMLFDNEPIEKITRFTNLTKEELEEIKKNM